jgi:hypothetical protein
MSTHIDMPLPVGAFRWHCLRRDVSNFALLKHRHFDGFVITMQHSGTHWLKFMMSTALALQLELPPPRFVHNDSSNDFIGHPKHARLHDRAPAPRQHPFGAPRAVRFAPAAAQPGLAALRGAGTRSARRAGLEL